VNSAAQSQGFDLLPQLGLLLPLPNKQEMCAWMRRSAFGESFKEQSMVFLWPELGYADKYRVLGRESFPSSPYPSGDPGATVDFYWYAVVYRGEPSYPVDPGDAGRHLLSYGYRNHAAPEGKTV
jgi:hypothetical protein